MDIQGSLMGMETKNTAIKTEIKDDQSCESSEQEEITPNQSVPNKEKEAESSDIGRLRNGKLRNSAGPETDVTYKSDSAESSEQDIDYICGVCKKSFDTQRLLTRHKRSCRVIEKIPCENCNMTFATKKAYVYHMNIHLGRAPYKCRVNCKEGFANPRRRTLHENNCSKPEPEPEVVASDQIVVGGEKMFVCRKSLSCEKAFFSLRSRTLHEEACQLPPVKMEIDVGESIIEPEPTILTGNMYVCRKVDCEQCFPTSQSRFIHEEVCIAANCRELIDHELVIIDGVKLYVCNICGEAIESSDVFQKHKDECREDEDE